jgi:predicted metal-binding membrane protein
MQHWRPGFGGAIRMGLSHGAYCVGCCWFMMSLLFVGGIMNLAWIVVLTIFVMAERLFPFGEIVGKVAGALAIAAAVMKLMGVI